MKEEHISLIGEHDEHDLRIGHIQPKSIDFANIIEFSNLRTSIIKLIILNCNTHFSGEQTWTYC